MKALVALGPLHSLIMSDFNDRDSGGYVVLSHCICVYFPEI